MRTLSDEMDRLFESFGFGGRSLGRWAERLGGTGQPALWSPQVEVVRRGQVPALFPSAAALTGERSRS